MKLLVIVNAYHCAPERLPGSPIVKDVLKDNDFITTRSHPGPPGQERSFVFWFVGR